LEAKHKEMVAVEIQTILDEGPAQKFEIVGSNGRVLPKLVKVTPVVKLIAAKQTKAAKPLNTVPSVAVAVNISSDSASIEEERSEGERDLMICNASVLAAWNIPGKRQAKDSAAAAPTKTSKRLANESAAATKTTTKPNLTRCTCNNEVTCAYCLQFELSQ